MIYIRRCVTVIYNQLIVGVLLYKNDPFPCCVPLTLLHITPCNIHEHMILLQCCMSAAFSALVLHFYFHLTRGRSRNRRLTALKTVPSCVRQSHASLLPIPDTSLSRYLHLTFCSGCVYMSTSPPP